MEGALSAPLPVRLLLFVVLPAVGWLTTSAPGPPSTAPQDGIRINVTTLRDNGEVSKEQVVLNITYENGQVYVNDLPVNSGVTRISCQTLIVKSGNLENSEEKNILELSLSTNGGPIIQTNEPVGAIQATRAQQQDVTEVDILVKNQRILRHSNFSLPLEESMLYSISQDSDILFTLPNLSKKVGSGSSLQTTSHYLTGNVETTMEGNALPGKLPETPLRAEPPSSYKVMCQWIEKLRKALCRFWGSVFPVFFMFLNVMVVGVLGAAGVIAVLKVFFPAYENNAKLEFTLLHTQAGCSDELLRGNLSGKEDVTVK
ncbi:hypothetical protein STEG23_034259 [Scotinomys teguina]